MKSFSLKIWSLFVFSYFCTPKTGRGLIKRSFSSDSVAQLVEQYTFNVWALGSSPSGITKSLVILRGFFIRGIQNSYCYCSNLLIILFWIILFKNQAKPGYYLSWFEYSKSAKNIVGKPLPASNGNDCTRVIL